MNAHHRPGTPVSSMRKRPDHLPSQAEVNGYTPNPIRSVGMAKPPRHHCYQKAGFRSKLPTSIGSTRSRTQNRATLNVLPRNFAATPVSSMPRIQVGPRHFGALFRPASLQKIPVPATFLSAQSKDLLSANRRRKLLRAIFFEAVPCAIVCNFDFRTN